MIIWLFGVLGLIIGALLGGLLDNMHQQKKLAKLQSETAAKTAELLALQKTQELLQSQEQQSRAMLEKSWQDKMTLLKAEFSNLAAKILAERSENLQSANQQQLSAIVNPLKERMIEFKTAVENAKNKNIELNSTMNTRFEKMLEMTKKLGDEATMLANALRNDNKKQGDWGEMILEKLLEDSGLQRGINYELQETLRDADGTLVKNDSNQIMRPDVIVHYPDGRDLIIDSKVSLAAYTDLVNAGGETEAKEALARHIRSVKSHVDELVRKKYTQYNRQPGRETLNFLVMFIPNDDSWYQVMRAEPNFWRQAFERKVLIVTPVNLMALLQTVNVAWVRAEQEENQMRILDTAAELLDRLYGFYADFDKVGQKLNDAATAYSQATGRLKGGDGKHSIVNSGEKLKKLGVRMKTDRPLPAKLQNDCDSTPLLTPSEPPTAG